MANTITVKGGRRDIDLEWVPTTQEVWRIVNGTRIVVAEPDVTIAEPETGAPTVVNVNERPHRWQFRLAAFDDATNADWDNVFDAVAELKRLVHGSDALCLHWPDGMGARIYLSVQLDGAAVASEHTIMTGLVDDGRAYFNQAAQSNKVATDVRMILTVEPTGNLPMQTLRNDLTNASFWFGSTTAPGWTFTGTTTNTLVSDIGFTPGYVQRCSASANGGVYSNAVSVPDGTSGVAYVWVYIEDSDGRVLVQIYNSTDASTVVSKTIYYQDSTAVSDKTKVDAAGNTWYRVSMSGTNSEGGARNWRLQCTASTNATDFNLDAPYMDVTTDTTTVPDAWCSSSNLENCEGFTSGVHNFIDLAHIPGDGLAKVRTKVVPAESGGSNQYFRYWWVSRRYELDYGESIDSSNDRVVVAASGGTSDETGGGSWAFQNYSGSRLSGAVTFRFTSSASSDVATIDQAIHSYNWNMLRWNRRAVMAYRTNSSACVATGSIRIGAAGNTLTEWDDVALPASATHWNLIELGTWSSEGFIPNQLFGLSLGAGAWGQNNFPSSLNYRVSVTGMANTEWFEIDFVALLPAGTAGEYAVIDLNNSAVDKEWNIDGWAGVVVDEVNYVRNRVIGEVFYAPAERWSRTAFLGLSSDPDHTPDDAFVVSFDVYPPVRTLGGIV